MQRVVYRGKYPKVLVGEFTFVRGQPLMIPDRLVAGLVHRNDYELYREPPTVPDAPPQEAEPVVEEPPVSDNPEL